MKKTIIFSVLLVAVAMGATLGFCPPACGFTGYEIGLPDKQEYQEIVFISGEPTLFKGTIKETSRVKDDTEQISLTYKLEDVAGSKGKLNRTLKVTSRIETRGAQEVRVTSLDSLTESISINGKQYKLIKESIYLNGSQVLDRQPVIDYITGDWYLKKTYEIGRDGGQVTVEMSGESDGYRNAWGEGETQAVAIRLEGQQVSEEQESKVSYWSGSARAVMNRTLSRILNYNQSNPDLISFSGSFVDKRQEEQILRVTYDLPAVDQGIISERSRNRDEQTFTVQSPPETKRLFIKECKDLRGHWARSAIESLCGLGAFDIPGDYFYPGIAMKRGEYIKALMVVGEATPAETAATTTRGRKATPEEPFFLDVDNNHPYFKYIQTAFRKGIVQGSGAVFNPNAQLTRAEAISIMVKAMGLENLAPTPSYTTGYYDDAQIPLWAKDSVYVATNYGLIKGDIIGGNRMFRPLDIVTRAEAASLLDQFRVYLNQDFRKDRERIYDFSP